MEILLSLRDMKRETAIPSSRTFFFLHPQRPGAYGLQSQHSPFSTQAVFQMDLAVQSPVRIFSGFQGRKVGSNHHRKGISPGRFQKAGGLPIIQKLDYGIPELNLATP